MVRGMTLNTSHDPLKLVDRIVGSSRVPTLPAAAIRLLKLCRSANTNAADLGEVIRVDPALTARLLEVVNSARYGLRQQVTSVDHAVAMLGIKAVRSLALGFSLLPMLRESADTMPALECVWRRSVIAAVAALEFAKATEDQQAVDDIFVPSLLQDLGVLAILAELRDPYNDLLRSTKSHVDLATAECKLYGADHARVGAALARSWGFPPEIVDAIRWHAEPEKRHASHLAKLSALGGLAADALALDQEQTPDHAIAGKLLESATGLSVREDLVISVLDHTRETANSLLRSFQFDTTRMADPMELLQQANRLLQEIALDQHQRLTKLDDANASLRKQADVDGLTGLLNRRALDRELLRLYERAIALSRPLSIVLFDLDRFKAINDRHGHNAGDHVLRVATERFSGQLRQGACLGRFGGEEFLLVLPDTEQESALQIAERLRVCLVKEPFQLPEGDSIKVTVSGGVAVLKTGASKPSSPEQFISRADAALYEAKEAGRDRIVTAPDQPLRHSA